MRLTVAKVRTLKHRGWHHVGKWRMAALNTWEEWYKLGRVITQTPWPCPFPPARVRRRPYEKLLRAIELRKEHERALIFFEESAQIDPEQFRSLVLGGHMWF